MKKLAMVGALLLGLSACGDNVPGVHPVVPGVVFGVVGCAMTGACVMP